ncbi:MAG: hypothetical protein A2231_05255 [Candidatus Firestonebacteria bacterium RIFOXYA2_FULL_40_8]|nr:MAG: hypothetical protein A2231_05255 [Candidatus Firestonebacteria bacterium RIFOXYA2_FULL_40_8]
MKKKSKLIIILSGAAGIIFLCVAIALLNENPTGKIYRVGAQAGEELAKANDPALKSNPEEIVEILKSKDPLKRKYLPKCFDVQIYVKQECWKEEYKNESVVLEKNQRYDVLFYRKIIDQSGRGKAFFLFYKNENKKKKFTCMLEFEEYGAQVNNAEGTFEYKWQSLIEGDVVKELIVKDYQSGHVGGNECVYIFKMINGELRKIFTKGLGGYGQVEQYKYESYKATIDIEEKGSFPRKILYSYCNTTKPEGQTWENSTYIWDSKSQKYTKK